MSAQPNLFKSKIGVIAATVGSAVGLGNIWRFPAEAQSGGGAAFLIVYVGCVLLLGVPVMMAEFALGRAGRTDAMGAFTCGHKRSAWQSVGLLSILTSFLIAVFYMVVTGWTIEYMFESITGSLYSSHPGEGAGADAHFASRMAEYVQGTWLPMLFTAAVVLLNLGILLAGVAKGIERLSNVLMPLLFLLLVAFCVVCLTLPGAGAGLEFFLRPDFSKVTADVVLNALGQAFFSLSLGMGILVTYAGYYPASTRLGKTAVTVAGLDMLVAVLMGLIVFPAVFSFGLADHSVAGTALVFVTLPEVFAQLPGCRIWSTLFFLLLSIAALTSTISICEVSIRFLQDRAGLSRRASCLWVMLTLLPLSLLCSLSLGPLSGWTIGGLTIFDFLDFVTANFMLPLAALGLCIYVGWVAPKGMLKGQLTNGGTLRSRLTDAAIWIIRYPAPLLILLIMFSPLIK